VLPAGQQENSQSFYGETRIKTKVFGGDNFDAIHQWVGRVDHHVEFSRDDKGRRGEDQMFRRSEPTVADLAASAGSLSTR